ncbi:hypothetical protein [Streptomyces sp. SAI-127]|uniref:hypothetical protein n=1 Tax=Streptomyces sp. SAI-127 TaxID=2940543 RepID=UPI002473E5E9|nr:hypothetical protein [Streptomyces sp. SAI-127]MDH6489653.1 hypothetical protein [Streptomyces sp. SAI-127]
MSADQCPEHRTRLDLCPHCQGLAVTRETRLDGVTAFQVRDAGGRVISSGRPAAVYISRVEPCPNTAALEEGAAHDV